MPQILREVFALLLTENAHILILFEHAHLWLCLLLGLNHVRIVLFAFDVLVEGLHRREAFSE